VIFNLAELELPGDDDLPEGHRFTGISLTDDVGSKLTGLSVYELPPGEKFFPYHFHFVVEEWLLVLSGELVLRTPDGERRLRGGDVACFVAGPSGAHTVLRNESGAPVRFVIPSTKHPIVGGAVYPDSGKFGIRSGEFTHFGRLGDPVEDYWEGEV
jgi:uncharacterized cupin superfamily protein